MRNKYHIYPKQFRNAGIPIEKHRCFMLMPFDHDYDLIYGEIKKRLNDSDYICNRADELFGCIPIMSNVLNEILKSHFIIADLTGQNANVFYELGVAHSFKDAHNIVLIAQNVGDIPFDIRHLSTIIYNKENIKHLTSSILKTVNENKHYYDFYEVLQKRSIINYIHDDKDEFIDSLENELGTHLDILTNVLNGRTDQYSESDIKNLLDSCIGVLYSRSVHSSRTHVKGIMKVLSCLLCQCKDFGYSYEVMIHLLHENKLENYPISKSDIISLQSDLAITLASNNVFFDDAISWIINYFAKSKSATVDLNRYSLERFLLTSDNTNVDTTIANSILHDNYYIREHMADIVGEKKIISAIPLLITQLKREENIYTTSSIITALGKLGAPKSYQYIVEWFETNRDRVIETHHFFILKHIYKSLKRLDGHNEYTLEFEKTYGEHLVPSAVF